MKDLLMFTLITYYYPYICTSVSKKEKGIDETSHVISPKYSMILKYMNV